MLFQSDPIEVCTLNVMFQKRTSVYGSHGFNTRIQFFCFLYLQNTNSLTDLFWIAIKRMGANKPNLKNPDSGKCNEWRSSSTAYRQGKSIRMIPEKSEAHNMYIFIFNAINGSKTSRSKIIRFQVVGSSFCLWVRVRIRIKNPFLSYRCKTSVVEYNVCLCRAQRRSSYEARSSWRPRPIGVDDTQGERERKPGGISSCLVCEGIPVLFSVPRRVQRKRK